MPRPSFAFLSVLTAASLAEAAPRETVRDWKVGDFDAVLFVALEGYRDFENGKRTFENASCLDCHRFGDRGPEVVAAPDLSKVGEIFPPRDLLESILHPGKVITTGYGQRKIRLKDGRLLEGIVIDRTGSGLTVVIDPRKAGQGIRLEKADIASDEAHLSSAMPEGLLDGFDEEDVLDLLAYLLSGGRSGDAMFRP